MVAGLRLHKRSGLGPGIDWWADVPLPSHLRAPRVASYRTAALSPPRSDLNSRAGASQPVRVRSR
ncbi:hypothetical protein CEP51_014655, partial [Fusarium floridanum]